MLIEYIIRVTVGLQETRGPKCIRNDAKFCREKHFLGNHDFFDPIGKRQYQIWIQNMKIIRFELLSSVLEHLDVEFWDFSFFLRK